MNFFNADGRGKMGFLTKLFIKSGLAKDQNQANRRMLAVSIVCLLLTIYIDVSAFAPDLLQFGQKTSTISVNNSKLHQAFQPHEQK